MINYSYCLWPDGKQIVCHVWTGENCDMQSYRVTRDVLRSVYPDMPLDEAIRVYAIARFTLFHNVDFEGRFLNHRRIGRRKTL